MDAPDMERTCFMEKFIEIFAYKDLFLKGLMMTIYVSVLSTFWGIIIGVLAGIARVCPNKFLRGISFVYVQIVRGIPILVFLLFIYFGLGSLIDMSPLFAGVLGLSVFSGAYVAEIIRGGIEALPRGQWEAASCLGLSYCQQMFLVILPQAFRSTLPALGGQFITLIKDSSLASVISVMEITMVSKNVVTRTFYALEVYMVTAVIYLVLTLMMTALVSFIEKRFVGYKI